MTYAITGITGKVGGALARTLIAAGEPVRAVVRDAKKGEQWAALGCEVALAELEDTPALTRAFAGATAAFILPPSVFDPEPGFPEARTVIDSVVNALQAAKPSRVLCLSTVGADTTQQHLLSQRGVQEAALRKLPMPLTILRACWFMDNAAWDLDSARTAGVIHSFLQPTDKPLAMVAAQDVGRLAAQLIRETSAGTHVFDVEGPRRVTPNDVAAAFSRALRKPVSAVPVPRESWEALFRSQGMKHPEPRMRMLDGFNEGWIEFADHGRHAIKGSTGINEVVAALSAARPQA